MQHDGQAAAAAVQACCCYCHQTRTLPVAPFAWECEAQKLLLLQMVCETLLRMMSRLMKHKQLHKHEVELTGIMYSCILSGTQALVQMQCL